MTTLHLPTLEGIRPRRFGLVSWSPHVAFAFDLVADLRPRMLVELGTHSGESYFAFCQAAQENHVGTTCYAVDTWKGDAQAGFYPEEIYAEVSRHNQEHYADFSYLVRATFDEAVNQFTDGSLDLIHFDGLHTYEAVKHDLERWRPKLSPRGVAIFHDIAARHDDFGAWKLWEEIRRDGQAFAFRHGWGLGVWKPAGGDPTGSPWLETLFAADEAEAENIRRYYLLATDALRLQKTTAETLRLGEALKAATIRAEGLDEEAARREGNLREAAALRDEALRVQAVLREEALQRDEAIRLAHAEREEALRVQAVLREEALQRDEALSEARTELAERLANGPQAQSLQVYFSRDGRFDEADSQSFPLTPNQWQRIALPLPTGWRGGSLRLDPGNGFALADVAGVRVYTTLLREEVWRRLGAELKDAAVPAGSAQPVTGARTLRVLCAEPDPQILLPDIDVSDFDEPLTLEIGIRLRTDLAGMIRTFQGLAVETAEWPALQERVRRLVVELAEKEQAHAAAREELARAREEFARQAAEQAQTEVERLAATQRQHAEELQSLRDALLKGEGEVSDLEAELHELRAEQEAERQENAASAREIAGLLEELHGVNVRLADKAASVDEIYHRLVDKDAQLVEAQARGEADHRRLRSMRRSASWKLTLPLRMIGRVLTGKTPNRQPPPPALLRVAPAPAPAATAYRFQLDEPTNWNLTARQADVRGWCLPAADSDADVPRLRFRCGDQQTETDCTVARDDVDAAHGDGNPAWQRCGFAVKIELPRGPSEVVVEALDAQGRTWPLARYSARAPYADHVPRAAEGDPAQDYAAWVARYDSFPSEARRRLRARARSLPYRPLISVVMPVYNPPEQWLVKAIESVRRQFYPAWELCIADDNSPAPHAREILGRYEQMDPRIKVVYRTENGHIAAASNSALNIATGEFVALLDHDDELAAHALYAVASEINAHPEADLIYSDEDKIDEEGRRSAPYFKPDWNPDLFLGQNYLCHLTTYRLECVRAVGGFRTGVDGSQDWDLALRIVETIPADHIRHVPRVLYHWRAIAGSTALALGEKAYIEGSARRVLSDHCQRAGLNAALVAVPGGHWRLRHALPRSAPLVSIIIPTRNQLTLLRQGVESILNRSSYPEYEILIIDNESDDPATLAYLERPVSPRVRVLRYPGTFNYSAINNFAVEQARGDLVCLLNSDMEVITPDWMEEMAGQALRPEIGAVGVMLYYPDDTIQHAGVVLGIGGVAGHAFKKFPRGTDGSFNRARLVQNYTAVTAACLMIRRDTFRQVGGLEQEKLRVGFNDIDFCLKVHAAGYRNLWTPFAEFYHHESASRGLEDTPEKQLRFRREVDYMLARWGSLLRNDPAYNLNWTLDREDFSFAVPPRLASLLDVALAEPEAVR